MHTLVAIADAGNVLVAVPELVEVVEVVEQAPKANESMTARAATKAKCFTRGFLTEWKVLPLGRARLATIYDHHKRDVCPTKSPGNDREAAKLLLVFGDSSIDSITPADVQRHKEARGATARVRANREQALLPHVWNFARAKGYTSLPNPCTGIKGYPSRIGSWRTGSRRLALPPA